MRAMTDNELANQARHIWLDHIPMLCIEPPQPTARRRLAIFLNGLGGGKQGMLPSLARLAEAGFVAVAYDPWLHGERALEPLGKVGDWVFQNFRRRMWPIIAHTAEEATRVIDWAVAELGVEPEVCMGGFSMGGDISVAAAGIERRIERVGAVVATPDWLRPGMNRPAGEPDAYARLLYDRLNPMTNLGHYNHCPAITFELGAEDPHVPNEAALRFQADLRETYRACPERLRVILHPGVGHAVVPAMFDSCVEWFGQG
jgi:uncharacterized protein